jgi:hypothetical protein
MSREPFLRNVAAGDVKGAAIVYSGAQYSGLRLGRFAPEPAEIVFRTTV